MSGCRCSMCGAKRAGRAGGKSYGSAVVMRDEDAVSDMGRDRRKERRLRRTRETRAWKMETAKE